MQIDVLIVGGSFRTAGRLESTLMEGGLSTVIATRDVDAIELCERTRVGVIVLPVDQDCPAALRLCAALRSLDRGRMVPILAITCLQEPWQDLSLLEAGSDDCLSLPDETGALCLRVRRLCELGRLRLEGFERASGPARCDSGSRAVRIAVLDPVADRRQETVSLLAPHFLCSPIARPSMPEQAIDSADVILVASSSLHGAWDCLPRPNPHVGDRNSPGLLVLTETGDDLEEYRRFSGFDDIVSRPIRLAAARARIRSLAEKRILSMEHRQRPPGSMLTPAGVVTLTSTERKRAA
jgi:DNA-binding response OmpR family regulator